MKKNTKQAGFTILELLIASMVFSIVLILCLEGITRIGKLYYKGVSMSQTQELIRSLTGDLTQQIQFGAKEPMEAVNGNASSPVIFCVGDFRYRAVMNRELGSPGVTSILKKIPYNGECVLSDTGFAGATELGSKGMRLQRLRVANTASRLWTVDIKVALGANDLMEFPSGSQDDASVYEQVTCRTGLAGSEFCATAELSTTIVRRIR